MQAGLMKTSNKQVMQAQPEPIIAGSDVRFVHAHTHTNKCLKPVFFVHPSISDASL